MKIVKNFIRKVVGAKIYVWIVVAVLAIFFVVAKTYNIIGYFQGKNTSNEQTQVYTRFHYLSRKQSSFLIIRLNSELKKESRLGKSLSMSMS